MDAHPWRASVGSIGGFDQDFDLRFLGHQRLEPFGDDIDPPPMKWSAVMFRKTEDQNGYEATAS